MKKFALSLCLVTVAAGLVFAGAKQQQSGGPTVYKGGFASLTEDNDFGVVTRESVEKKAREFGWQLVIANNNYDGATAIQNTDLMITQKVAGYINFQVDAGVAPVVAEMAIKAKIPMLTIDCPHPGIPFFGANNKEAGLLVGRGLGDKAIADWGGKVDLIILCGAPDSGEVVALRMNSIVDGIVEKIPAAKGVRVLNLDGKSEIETSQKVIADTLTANPNLHNILIGTLNDPSGLGAYNAIVAAKRQQDVLLCSHGFDVPSRTHFLNDPPDFWFGSVAYFPERYGDYVVPLMQQMMEGKKIPDYNYVEHVFVDKAHVNQYLPK
jgi:ribose transport system substrate-binding protein